MSKQGTNRYHPRTWPHGDQPYRTNDVPGRTVSKWLREEHESFEKYVDYEMRDRRRDLYASPKISEH
jgi:hypothetical protein